MAQRELLLLGMMVHRVFVAEYHCPWVFTVKYIGEVFRHSIKFVGHANKSVNTVLRKESRGRWFGNTITQEAQFSNQRSSMAILFYHSHVFLCFCCISAPPVVPCLLSCSVGSAVQDVILPL